MPSNEERVAEEIRDVAFYLMYGVIILSLGIILGASETILTIIAFRVITSFVLLAFGAGLLAVVLVKSLKIIREDVK